MNLFKLNGIVSVDQNWGIGYNGKLLHRNSHDMRQFRDKTRNNIILMGRKTFESLPYGKALPDRINVVMTRNEYFSRPDVIVDNDINHIMNIDPSKEVYLIGGGEMFFNYYNQCHKIYVTKWQTKYPNVDTYMPNLDEDDNWVLALEQKVRSENDVDYSICEYINKEFMKFDV